MNSIEVHSISKTYNGEKVLALQNVSFQVKKGELFGLIGPDGAGKTSLFRILTTVLLPNSGTATVEGCDVVNDYKHIRTIVGYMPGRFSLYQDLTVEENLDFFAKVFKTTIQSNYNLIRDIYVQLEPFKQRRSGKLSGGMKQKLALCCALIHKPLVLFLDEPTTGVDPVSRKEFWEMLSRLKEQGITILVSTPYMDEAALCDRIALIQNGRILRIDSPSSINSAFSDTIFSVQVTEMYRALQDLRIAPFTKHCFGFGDSHHLTVHGSSTTPQEVYNFLQQHNHTSICVKQIEPSIEDTFMSLSGVDE